MKSIFFRNDDVRNKLDKSLVNITELFIEHNVPISHSVEPANINDVVVTWLLSAKIKYPDLIEITQHGYDHKQKAISISGEFGGIRTYTPQYEEIRAGYYLMNKYFNDKWFRAFTFPYGSYNQYTLEALNDLKYGVISTGCKHSLRRITFNKLGTMFRKKFILKKPVVYFNKKIPRTNIIEIPTLINFTKKTFDENNSTQKSFDELVKELNERVKHYSIIGFLMHHRWLSDGDITTMNNFLLYLKDMKYNFLTMEKIGG